MRAIPAFLTTVAAILVSSGCAPVASSLTSSSAGQSSVLGLGVPEPSATVLRSPASGAKPRGWLDAKRATGSLIYIAAGNEVAIYRENDSRPVGAITDGVAGAYGLFADAKGGLYVANTTTITAYRPGTIHPWITYIDTASPLYVVADHSGRVYAANRGGTVTEYPRQQTMPDVTIKTPGHEADGINFDDAGNLYVAYRGRSVDSIEEFAPNSTDGRILGMHVSGPQGLQIDHSGNIIVVESGNGTVDIFPPGKNHPSKVVNVDIGATQIVLGGNQRNIYYSTYTNHNVYIGPYPPSAFSVKIASGLNYTQGMALSHEER
jgi:sugar lactone lactonase YvrE